jgi:hypothetical protein
VNTDTIRYYLHDLEYMDKLIEKLKTELEEFRKMQVDSIKIPIMTGMPGTHGNTSLVETITINRVVEIDKRERQLFELILLRGCIEDALESLREETAIDYILKDRYLQGDRDKKTLKQISYTRQYDYQVIRNEDSKFMNRILNKFKEKGYTKVTHEPKVV